MKEIWKKVKGYPNYKISNLGRVKSFTKTKPFIMKKRIDKYGYERLMLSKDGKAKPFRVHRLVAVAFIKNTKNYPCVNHIDGNKSNNNKQNLEWCSYSQNTQHSYNIGIRVSGMKGKKHPSRGSKHFKFIGYYLTPYGKFSSLKDAANAEGCSASTISRRTKNPNIKTYLLLKR